MYNKVDRSTLLLKKLRKFIDEFYTITSSFSILKLGLFQDDNAIDVPKYRLYVKLLAVPIIVNFKKGATILLVVLKAI